MFTVYELDWALFDIFQSNIIWYLNFCINLPISKQYLIYLLLQYLQRKPIQSIFELEWDQPWVWWVSPHLCRWGRWCSGSRCWCTDVSVVHTSFWKTNNNLTVQFCFIYVTLPLCGSLYSVCLLFSAVVVVWGGTSLRCWINNSLLKNMYSPICC